MPTQKHKAGISAGEEHKIITDAMLLERAFSNVMSNCIRYAGTQVAVAVREKEGDIPYYGDRRRAWVSRGRYGASV